MISWCAQVFHKYYGLQIKIHKELRQKVILEIIYLVLSFYIIEKKLIGKKSDPQNPEAHRVD